MPENTLEKTGQTIISLILPETGAMPREGSILAKYESADGKQSLAHLMPFSYSSLADIARAIEAAQQQLEILKANPPQITVPTPLDSTNTANKAVKAAKPSPQKPKKKKISLDDLPEDDDAEEVSVAEDEIDGDETASLETEETALGETRQDVSAAVPQNPTTGLKVGDTVEISDGTLDMDGELVPFNTGKVVEIDLSANPPRVWLESSDGEEDVWLPLAALTKQKAPANDLSAFEKPIGMGVPNKEGQLTLFG